MYVTITKFVNPFSFFCLPEDVVPNEEYIIREYNNSDPLNKLDFSEVCHGQYVAVLWNNKWVRGIVTMETNFLIWLIDYGIYLRPDNNTVYLSLPSNYKKYPTKVFEASIHGVAPVDRVLTNMLEIENAISTKWNTATHKRVDQLLTEAIRCYFIPIAIISTKENDVVIGDLYLQLKESRNMVNIIEKLELWPSFLQKHPEFYIQNLSKFYISRRQHRLSKQKPSFLETNLPTMTLDTTLVQYRAICRTSIQSENKSDSDSEEGSTLTFLETVPDEKKNNFLLTPAEMELYSNQYITIAGREYNVLSVVVNKARDLYMCEKYKDLKSVGRATSRRPRST